MCVCFEIIRTTWTVTEETKGLVTVEADVLVEGIKWDRLFAGVRSKYGQDRGEEAAIRIILALVIVFVTGLVCPSSQGERQRGYWPILGPWGERNKCLVDESNWLDWVVSLWQDVGHELVKSLGVLLWVHRWDLSSCLRNKPQVRCSNHRHISS